MNFWPNFDYFLILPKTVAYLMHHLAYHHWSKMQADFGQSSQKPTHKQPKMTISASTKTFENLKLENYRFRISKTCPVCVPP